MTLEAANPMPLPGSQSKSRSEPMKLAIIPNSSPKTTHSWSGIPYFAVRALAQRLPDCEVIDTPISDKLLGLLRGASINVSLDVGREQAVSRFYAALLERQLRQIGADVILSIGATPKIAHLGRRRPIVHFADATFASMVDYYPRNYSNLRVRTLRAGIAMDQRAFDNCRYVLMSSDWAASSVVRDFGIAADRVRVVPMGACLDTAPILQPALTYPSPLRLLFVGVDWTRKGGPATLEIWRSLRQSFPEAELNIVGCTADEVRGQDGIIHHGFLSKDDPTQRTRLETLYRQASFLVVPSRQEAFGLVYCEACAFGVPVVATDTGGVSTIVKDGVNGFLLDHSHPDIPHLVERLRQTWTDAPRYARMRDAARARYETDLNWQAWAEGVERALRDALSQPSPG